MKWQAVTIMANSSDGLRRQDSAALIALLDAIAVVLQNEPPPHVVTAARERLDAEARLRDHPPLVRRAGGGT